MRAKNTRVGGRFVQRQWEAPQSREDDPGELNCLESRELRPGQVRARVPLAELVPIDVLVSLANLFAGGGSRVAA